MRYSSSKSKSSFRRKPRFYKSSKVYKRKSISKSLSLKQKKEVKKLIHNQLENKMFTNSGYITAQPCGLGSGVGSLSTNQTFQIDLSNLLQGTAENQRIGNKIRIMKATLRCVLTMNPQTVSGVANAFVPGQFICRMFIVQIINR